MWLHSNKLYAPGRTRFTAYGWLFCSLLLLSPDYSTNSGPLDTKITYSFQDLTWQREWPNWWKRLGDCKWIKCWMKTKKSSVGFAYSLKVLEWSDTPNPLHSTPTRKNIVLWPPCSVTESCFHQEVRQMSVFSFGRDPTINQRTFASTVTSQVNIYKRRMQCHCIELIQAKNAPDIWITFSNASKQKASVTNWWSDILEDWRPILERRVQSKIHF